MMIERIDNRIHELEEELAMCMEMRRLVTENEQLVIECRHWKEVSAAMQDLLDGKTRPITELLTKAGEV